MLGNISMTALTTMLKRQCCENNIVQYLKGFASKTFGDDNAEVYF
jgi:hypothetical protein